MYVMYVMYVLFVMVWYGMVWSGLAWRGVAWGGMVWYGMVWHGMYVCMSRYNVVKSFAVCVVYIYKLPGRSRPPWGGSFGESAVAIGDESTAYKKVS